MTLTTAVKLIYKRFPWRWRYSLRDLIIRSGICCHSRRESAFPSRPSCLSFPKGICVLLRVAPNYSF